MITNMFLYVSTKASDSFLAAVRRGGAQNGRAMPGIFVISKQHKLGFEWQKW